MNSKERKFTFPAILILSLLAHILEANSTLDTLNKIDILYENYTSEDKDNTQETLISYIFESQNKLISEKAAAACSKIPDCKKKFIETFPSQSYKLSVELAINVMGQFYGDETYPVLKNYLLSLPSDAKKTLDFQKIVGEQGRLKNGFNEGHIIDVKKLLLSTDPHENLTGYFLSTHFSFSEISPVFLEVLNQKSKEDHLDLISINNILRYLAPYQLEEDFIQKILELDRPELTEILLDFVSRCYFKSRSILKFASKYIHQDEHKESSLNALLTQVLTDSHKNQVTDIPLKKIFNIYLHDAKHDNRQTAFEILTRNEQIEDIQSVNEEIEYMLGPKRAVTLIDLSLINLLGSETQSQDFLNKYTKKITGTPLEKLSESDRCFALTLDLNNEEKWQSILKIINEINADKILSMQSCFERLASFDNPRLLEFSEIAFQMKIPLSLKAMLLRMPLNDIDNAKKEQISNYTNALNNSPHTLLKQIAAEIKLHQAQKDPALFIQTALGSSVEAIEGFFEARGNVDNYEGAQEHLKELAKQNKIPTSAQAELLMSKFGGRNYILGAEASMKSPPSTENEDPSNWWASLYFPESYNQKLVEKLRYFLNHPNKKNRLWATKKILGPASELMSPSDINHAFEIITEHLKDPNLKTKTVISLDEVANPTLKERLSKLIKKETAPSTKESNPCRALCKLSEQIENMFLSGDETYKTQIMENPTVFESAILNLQLSFLIKSQKLCKRELKFHNELQNALSGLLSEDPLALNKIKTPKLRLWLNGNKSFLKEPEKFSGLEGKSSSEIYLKQYLILLLDEINNNKNYQTVDTKNQWSQKIASLRLSLLNDIKTNETSGISGSFMNTYASSSSLFHLGFDLRNDASPTYKETIKSYLDHQKLLINKLAFGYSLAPQYANKESERGASARAVTTYLSLYKQDYDSNRRLEHRDWLLLALENYFYKYFDDLTMHVHRNQAHEGNDKLAPYYFYSTLPYAIEGINQLIKDPSLDENQKSRLFSMKKEATQKTLGMMREDGLFYQEGGNSPDTDYSQSERYNNPLGGLALLGSIDSCSQEPINVFYPSFESPSKNSNPTKTH